MKNFNGEILILANRNVNQIINLSQSKKVENTIKSIIPELEKINYIVKKSVSYLGISSLGDSSVVYMIKMQSYPDRQWQAKRDAFKIIKDKFEEDNIKIPYPQIEVHNGKNI